MSTSEDAQSQEILSEILSESDESSQGVPELDYGEQSIRDQTQRPSGEQSFSVGGDGLDSLAAKPDSNHPPMSDVLSYELETCSHPASTGGNTATQSRNTFETVVVRQTHRILKDPTNILMPEYQLLPSGRRHRAS
ncbi:hypothetical protein ABVT39_026392, partial [Epinephelus coioides]